MHRFPRPAFGISADPTVRAQPRRLECPKPGEVKQIVAWACSCVRPDSAPRRGRPGCDTRRSRCALRSRCHFCWGPAMQRTWVTLAVGPTAKTALSPYAFRRTIAVGPGLVLDQERPPLVVTSITAFACSGRGGPPTLPAPSRPPGAGIGEPASRRGGSFRRAMGWWMG